MKRFHMDGRRRLAACLYLAALLPAGGCTVVTAASAAASVAASAVSAGVTVGEVAVSGAATVAKGAAGVVNGGDHGTD